MIKPLRGAQLDLTHPHAKGLVACYLMNEGTGDILNDLSKNGNDGTINNSNWKSGNNGYSLEFLGANDYVDCGSNVLNESLFSIFFKLKLMSNPAWHSILGSADDVYENRINIETWNDPTIHAYMRTGDVAQISIASDIISLNEWNTFLFTVNEADNGAYFYQNGILKSSDASFSSPDLSAESFYVGRAKPGVHNVDHQLEFVYVYNRELSATESLSLHKNPYDMFI